MPRWKHHLRLKDVFYNEDLTFEQRRDEIVRRIRAARWFVEDADYATTLLEQLEFARDEAEFDGWWNEFYDYADAERVWIETC
jgi:hypothetical protein